jgi:SAM-dependent methyltransferase
VKFSVDRALRRVFPSISKLTFNSLFAAALDLSDLPMKLLYPELRDLPPNHFRVRIGVGNRLFNNQIDFLTGPPNFWMEAFANGWFSLDGTVIDIGSGCGRYARVLRDYAANGQAFSGAYVGVDIDQEMIAWCAKAFPVPQFRFHASTDASASYNKDEAAGSPFRIPEPDASADLIFSRSLFTHLLEQEAENYLRESFRLLRSGGTAHHSVFCLDYPPPTMGGRHTFSHIMGKAYVESLRQPTAAVAYTEAALFEMARAAGFTDMEVRHTVGEWQPSLICRKA